jgi:hypothetical protein
MTPITNKGHIRLLIGPILVHSRTMPGDDP